MNLQLEEVIERVKALPDDRQQEAAFILLGFLDQENPDLYLSPEQIAEIERCMSDNKPFASEKEVRSVFPRLTE